MNISKVYWYILDYRSLLDVRVIKAKFLTKRAAQLFHERGLDSKPGYTIMHGERLQDFKVRSNKLKKRFCSKYEVPDIKLLSRQGKKTFRTVMRRRLWGYIRLMPYSRHCDVCYKSDPNNLHFAKIAPFLIKGRILRACEKCTNKHYKIHTENGTLTEINEYDNLPGMRALSRLNEQSL